MDMLMALAVSIGVLIALWVKFGGLIGVAIAVPAGIVAWACFYAAGGKTQGLQKAIAANLSGVVWVLLANLVISGAGLQSFGWIVIGIVAFLIVMQSKLPVLSFIPGAFCGAALTAASGAGTDIKVNLMVAVAMIVGAVLGYVSEMVGGMIAKKA
ncbi:MAG: hypothetical protein AUI99_01025 [Gemmatimonadetes bacterium 13_1_40CM_3_69_22]|nr:MAG: hypothetical protein AUI99_01025 [Gemmatimonadetes bacterium 13_1_40CM_3_69_22]OLD93501.1 MAG: hypothetical protein AUG79_11480 [Gemmatimonadetes bacterium 13_1_20CM_4_69_16]